MATAVTDLLRMMERRPWWRRLPQEWSDITIRGGLSWFWPLREPDVAVVAELDWSDSVGASEGGG